MADEPTSEVTQDHDDPGSADSTSELERLAGDLEGVGAALARLDSGEYWTDEISGKAIDDEVLAGDPTARRNP